MPGNVLNELYLNLLNTEMNREIALLLVTSETVADPAVYISTTETWLIDRYPETRL